MEIILLHKHYDVDHLQQVMAEMETLGAPTIKCVYDAANDVFFALEGCHRIRAAHVLGLTPEIEEVDSDDMMIADLGLQWDNTDCAASATMDYNGFYLNF